MMKAGTKEVRNPAWGQSPIRRIDVARYTTREYANLEMERLWPQVWQIACREEEVPNAGDYFEYVLGNQSILVVRTRTDVLKAYFNNCLHRGTQLAKGCGNVDQFVCPFHAWRWSLDGQIRYVHDRADFPGLSDEQLQLPECQVGLFGGFVFIKMAEGGPTLAEFLAPISGQIGPYRLEDYRIQSWRTTIVKANWKIALEVFEESYHVMGTHPQALTTTDDVHVVNDRFGVHSRSIIPNAVPSARFEGDIAEQQVLEDTIEGFLDVELSDDGQRQMLERLRAGPLPPGMTTRELFRAMAQRQYAAILPDLEPDQYLTIWDYTIFPNFVFNALPGTIFGFIARPNGSDPDSCVFDVVSLQHPCGAQPPAVARQSITDPDHDWGLALSQDWSNLERIQRGMHNRVLRHTRLASYQELRIATRMDAIDAFLDA
jgi:phenylpropionate dioxygenase-like ring-hydroxylating dioxygenase large terminal subunit